MHHFESRDIRNGGLALDWRGWYAGISKYELHGVLSCNISCLQGKWEGANRVWRREYIAEEVSQEWTTCPKLRISFS